MKFHKLVKITYLYNENSVLNGQVPEWSKGRLKIASASCVGSGLPSHDFFVVWA